MTKKTSTYKSRVAANGPNGQKNKHQRAPWTSFKDVRVLEVELEFENLKLLLQN